MDTADPPTVAAETEAARALRSCVGPRRAEVLDLVARGATTKEIAAALGISPETVHDHVTLLLHGFGVRNRTALACLYHGGTPVHGGRPPRDARRRTGREE